MKNPENNVDKGEIIMQNGVENELSAQTASKLASLEKEAQDTREKLEYQGSQDLEAFLLATQQTSLGHIPDRDGCSFFWASNNPESKQYYSRYLATGKVRTVSYDEAKSWGIDVEALPKATDSDGLVRQGDLVLCRLPTALRMALLKRAHHDLPNELRRSAGAEAVETMSRQTKLDQTEWGKELGGKKNANFTGV